MVKTRYLGDDVLLCGFSDITTRKQLEKKLIEASNAADEANKAKSVFLATLSHEIRTPLHGIIGNLEILEKSNLTPVQHDRLRTITASSVNLIHIINDILDFTKIESRKMTLESIPFDIVDVVEQVVLLSLIQAQRKHIALHYAIAPGTAQEYLGDPIRIQQIILNLVSNAIKFTDHGKVNIQIETIVDERGECLSIRIIDTGIGITYTQQQEIFMPFVQADASIARRYGGTGLGLSLCSKLCELMNGSIAVRSASKLDGHSHSGSEFKVTLPLAISREVTKLIEPVPDQDATPLVFLCDDPDWESAITPYLHRWGFSVTHTLSVDQIQRQDSLILMLDDKNAWNQVKKRYGGPIIQLTDTSTRQVEATDKRTFVSRYWLWGIKTALSCVVAPLLPMTNAKSQDQPATDAAPPRAINVLVLEDHPVNLELINDQLQDLGYDAKLADNAGGAFELYNQFHFDLILTDLNLGGMDGYTFAKILRDLGAKQPIIAITANVSDEERRLCKEAGINDVLMKPVLLKDIRAVVEHYLNVKPSLGTDTAGETPANRFPPDLLLVLKNTTIESFKKIDALQKANNIPPLLAELHSVKGAFGMIGKKWVVELCAEAERTIKAAPLLDHHADLKRLEHEIMVHMDWVL